MDKFELEIKQDDPIIEQPAQPEPPAKPREYEQAAEYDRIYGEIIEANGKWLRLQGRTRASVAAHCTGHVLDIGCGIGRLANLVDEYTGIDFSAVAIAYAKEHHESDAARFIHADALEWLHECETMTTYDTAVLDNVIEHFSIADAKRLVAGCKRIAERVIVVVPENSPNELHTRSQWTPVDLITAAGPLVTCEKVPGFWLGVWTKDDKKEYTLRTVRALMNLGR